MASFKEKDMACITKSRSGKGSVERHDRKLFAERLKAVSMDKFYGMLGKRKRHKETYVYKG